MIIYAIKWRSPGYQSLTSVERRFQTRGKALAVRADIIAMFRTLGAHDPVDLVSDVYELEVDD